MYYDYYVDYGMGLQKGSEHDYSKWQLCAKMAMDWNISEIARNNIFNSENRAHWQVSRFRMQRFATESKLLQ